MERNLPPNLPPPPPDPHACLPLFTPTSSASSALTMDALPQHSLFALPWLDESLVWTDEKHNLYLDYLESSFVRQLHCSMGLDGFQSQENNWAPYLSQQLPASGHTCYEQIGGQNSCWQKINYGSDENLLNSTADSNDIIGSPGVRHVTCAGQCCLGKPLGPTEITDHTNGIYLNSNMNDCEAAMSLEQYPDFCYESLAGGAAEASDQNFVDEKQGNISGCMFKANRSKMAAADASNCEAVSYRKIGPGDDSTTCGTSSKRGKKKLLSKRPERFTSPKSDLHNFLRGS